MGKSNEVDGGGLGCGCERTADFGVGILHCEVVHLSEFCGVYTVRWSWVIVSHLDNHNRDGRIPVSVIL
jgi:hypothetical protein